MKLSELEVGQSAIIIGFERSDMSIKLMEMGLIPGEKIYIDKVAPLGDPISIFVSGYTLSLRIDEASDINVQL